MIRKLAAIALFSAAAIPGLAAAQQCEINVNANDAMQFDVKEITVDKACKEFTVNLKHTGKLPVTAMGHNWVLTKEEDMQAVANAAVSAGASNGYLPPDDKRVIAHTKLLGGGEQDSVTFDVSKLQPGQSYMFFCSFPGHWSIMKGPLKLSS